MSHEHHLEKEIEKACKCEEKCCNKKCKFAFEVAKLALKAATVAVLICAVKEVHKVHQAIEKKK